jgi:hypothetical protein
VPALGRCISGTSGDMVARPGHRLEKRSGRAVGTVSFRQPAQRCGGENGIRTKLAGWRAIGGGATSSRYRSFPALRRWTIAEVLHARVPSCGGCSAPPILAVDSKMVVFELQTGQMAGFGNPSLVSLSVLVLVIESYANLAHEESTKITVCPAPVADDTRAISY